MKWTNMLQKEELIQFATGWFGSLIVDTSSFILYVVFKQCNH